MSNIEYSYEIIDVDPQARSMVIVYTSPGRPTMHIGARLPFAGESLEQLVDVFSPVAYWRELAASVVVPAVGTTGTVTPPPVPEVTLESVKAEKLAEIAAHRYIRETQGVEVNGAVVKTDRESQATINGAFASLKAGFITSVDWKTADGTFVVLGLSEISAIAQAVAAHVQECFTQEKAFVEQVNAATSIAEVRAIDPTSIISTTPFGAIPSTEL